MSYQGTKINPTKFHRSQLKFYFYLIPIAILMLLPIIYIFCTAFKPIDELFAYPPRFFVNRPTLDNFKQLFNTASNSEIPMARYLLNSIVISLITVTVTVIVCLTSGYALSKKKFKAKKLIFTINTFALMFVPIAVNIPRFIIIEKLGLLDNFLVHILPSLAMPVGLFLVKQFIDQVPDALIEAATIDGATDFTIIRKIIAPIVKPALVTVAILVFQSVWNSADTSVMFINNESMKNFAFYMTTLSSNAGNSIAVQGLSAAVSLILFLPNLIIFTLMQSRVINTMAHTGIK